MFTGSEPPPVNIQRMKRSIIDPEQPVVTLINTFTVAPERQEELIQRLVEATERVMVNMPGFVSANIHRGLDGTHVANYAQWRSREDFEAMLRDPVARAHMGEAGAIARFEPLLYEVADSIAAGDAPTPR
jgi:heme-degrading monooxygenase HmoA